MCYRHGQFIIIFLLGDKTLVQSLLFDAKATDVYNNSKENKNIEQIQK